MPCDCRHVRSRGGAPAAGANAHGLVARVRYVRERQCLCPSDTYIHGLELCGRVRARVPVPSRRGPSAVWVLPLIRALGSAPRSRACVEARLQQKLHLHTDCISTWDSLRPVCWSDRAVRAASPRAVRRSAPAARRVPPTRDLIIIYSILLSMITLSLSSACLSLRNRGRARAGVAPGAAKNRILADRIIIDRGSDTDTVRSIVNDKKARVVYIRRPGE